MCWAREARLLCSVRHPSGTNQRWELYLRQWLNSVMATAWWAIPFELGNVGPPRVNSGVKNQVDRLHAVSFSLLPALDRFPTSPSRLWNGLSSGQSYTSGHSAALTQSLWSEILFVFGEDAFDPLSSRDLDCELVENAVIDVNVSSWNTN
jgi:hypothetical protein